MATETDAARDRVLAARTEFDEELIRLEASGRAALDIPAKIRRSPAKAVAVVGGLGFLALKGPQRVVPCHPAGGAGQERAAARADAPRRGREDPASHGQ